MRGVEERISGKQLLSEYSEIGLESVEGWDRVIIGK